jgi:hypothetical protein|tara:strand:- start:553 stop:699 length:147 start_codon:yes stop_codon:yes gene_type:complete
MVAVNKSEHSNQGFLPELPSSPHPLIQYDWRSNFQTLNDCVAAMTLLG